MKRSHREFRRKPRRDTVFCLRSDQVHPAGAHLSNLHNDLQQRIYAVQMQLLFLRDGLQSENDATQREVADIGKELADILKIARNLSIDLSPPMLSGEGLAQAIDWVASRTQQYGLDVEIQANGSFVFPDEQLHAFLFKCVRELLFNVVKHAETRHAGVTLQWVDTGLQIEVRDDGKGFRDSRRAIELPLLETKNNLMISSSCERHFST